MNTTKTTKSRLSRKKATSSKSKIPLPVPSAISNHTRSKVARSSLSMPTLDDLVSSPNIAASGTYVVDTPIDGTPVIDSSVPSTSSDNPQYEFLVPLTPPVITENCNVTISVAPPTDSPLVIASTSPTPSPCLSLSIDSPLSETSSAADEDVPVISPPSVSPTSLCGSPTDSPPVANTIVSPRRLYSTVIQSGNIGDVIRRTPFHIALLALSALPRS